MSTATATPSTTSSTAGDRGSALTGTGTLLWFMLRRDRIRFWAWSLGIPAFMGYFVVALQQVYATPEDVQAVAPLFQGPMGALFGGPGYGMDDPGLEHLLAGLYGVYIILGAALMSLLTVVRHTRAEEHSGRSELVRASVVGRHAQLTAALILTAAMNVVVVVLIGALMSGQGFDAAGSWLFAVSAGAVGMSFAGVAATTAQLTEYPRAASSAAGAVLGTSFALRALGDMTSEHGNVLSWLSPIGWAQQTAPYTLNRWWPLAISAAFAAGTMALGYVLSTRRDLAAGLVPPRPGPARAEPWLGSPLALAWRLQRAQVIGWSIALAVFGAAYGAFTGPALDIFDDAPAELVAVMGGGEEIANGFLNVLALTFGLTIAVFVVLAVQGFRGEELSGRAEPVLATAVSRQRWLGCQLMVTALAALWLLVIAALATGVAAAVSVGDAGTAGDVLLAGVVFAAPVWLVLALAALLYATVPRALPAIWLLVVYGLIAGFFGPLMDLPDAAGWLSPFEHIGSYPVDPVSWVGTLVLTLAATAATAVALVAFRQRDILGTG
ncbi:ABC transporter permease [Pseudactinotalea sp.]|uniref:ABC transporter permease n=1 Tax=Pseudactinotalea sp. TaxID=1926260 RepID=UPI003B3A1D25